MKNLLSIIALSVFVPLAFPAGKSAKPKPVTLTVSSCQVNVDQPCLLVIGSGYVAGKNVTIDMEGVSSETFVTPVDRNGNIALYTYEAFAPGSYTATAYEGSTKAMASTGFDIQ